MSGFLSAFPSHRIHFQTFLFCSSNRQNRSSLGIFLLCCYILSSNLCQHFPNQFLDCLECKSCKFSRKWASYLLFGKNFHCTLLLCPCILQGIYISRKGSLVTLHCCRIQVIYSPITAKHFFTAYTYCF